MADNGLHLVLTDLWKIDPRKRYLFLGQWCLNKEKTNTLEKQSIPYEVYSHQMIDYEKKYKDLEYCYQVVDELMSPLSKSLNEVLGKSYSKAEWFILLGPFLQNYVALLFNRYFDIKNCLELKEVSSLEAFKYRKEDLVGSDTLGYYRSIKDSLWNQGVYQFILEFLGGDYNCSDKELAIKHVPTRISYSLKSKIVNFVFGCLGLVTRFNNVFIKSSYLPFKEEVLLCLKQRVIPSLFRSPDVKDYPINKEMRLRLERVISPYCLNLDEFSKLYLSLIPWIFFCNCPNNFF